MSSTSRTGLIGRNRGTLLVALGVLALLVVVAWVQRDQARFAGPLDPRNPTGPGAQALARVLDDHGVGVRVVRDQSAYLDRTVDADTTVVVTNPQDLGRRSLDELRRHAAGAGALVLVGTTGRVLDAFHLAPGSVAGGDVPADCAISFATGLALRVPTSTGVVGAGCFGSGGTVLLSRPAPGEPVWLLSAPEVLRNDAVLHGDNAALALRLLGQHPKVLWYVANPADISASDAVTVSSLLPDWLFPALWVLLLSLLTFLVWRARRLGPLVREPLPVVVRAAESTESRGHLYRRTRDRDHAAAILRQATRRRLTRLLAVPPASSVEDLAVAVAGSVDDDLADVRRLLADAPVITDSALAHLGRALLRLESEVSTR